MEVAIYGMFDPRDGIIRYVGQTKRFPIKLRRDSHRAEAQMSRDSRWRSHLMEWLIELADDAIMPEIVMLELTTHEQAASREKFWVEHFRIEGAELVNSNYCQKSAGGLYWKRFQAERWNEWLKDNPITPREPRAARSIDPASAAKIREFRGQWGLSQIQLAKRLGYNNSSISLWESSKRTPPHGIDVLLEKVARDLTAERLS